MENAEAIEIVKKITCPDIAKGLIVKKVLDALKLAEKALKIVDRLDDGQILILDVIRELRDWGVQITPVPKEAKQGTAKAIIKELKGSEDVS